MPKLELYYMDICPFSQKVLRFMSENNLNDKILLKEIRLNDYDRETLINVGGKEQVPCLFIDGKPLYESDDIIAYLKENIL
ncbi:glutaredoxin family protein [Miniphocaeibacter massiliensis]|uniref:glutaredoxin family protein n=1 Tax=Miniphocaeibacter massiliensis TaxID=2041841 RepID=UPI000C1BAC0B|nr:glutathione S-transferase N-terminal domain-containing protein [Miniphocaeibacter massiliensis]